MTRQKQSSPGLHVLFTYASNIQSPNPQEQSSGSVPVLSS